MGRATETDDEGCAHHVERNYDSFIIYRKNFKFELKAPRTLNYKPLANICDKNIGCTESCNLWMLRQLPESTYCNPKRLEALLGIVRRACWFVDEESAGGGRIESQLVLILRIMVFTLDSIVLRSISDICMIMIFACHG